MRNFESNEEERASEGRKQIYWHRIASFKMAQNSVPVEQFATLEHNSLVVNTIAFNKQQYRATTYNLLFKVQLSAMASAVTGIIMF